MHTHRAKDGRIIFKARRVKSGEQLSSSKDHTAINAEGPIPERKQRTSLSKGIVKSRNKQRNR
jgi:hypothetical protein